MHNKTFGGDGDRFKRITSMNIPAITNPFMSWLRSELNEDEIFEMVMQSKSIFVYFSDGKPIFTYEVPKGKKISYKSVTPGGPMQIVSAKGFKKILDTPSWQLFERMRRKRRTAWPKEGFPVGSAPEVA